MFRNLVISIMPGIKSMKQSSTNKTIIEAKTGTKIDSKNKTNNVYIKFGKIVAQNANKNK